MKKALFAVAAALVPIVSIVLGAGEPHVEASANVAPATGCGAMSCTVYLPIVFKPVPVQVAQFEVTQGVQQPNNSVLLVASRPTYLRWTLTSSTAYTDVNALLYGTRNGVALPGSPLGALNSPRTLKNVADRAALNDTFNFKLPGSWASGEISLYARAANATGFVLRSTPVNFQFSASAGLSARVVPIAYHCSSSSAVVLPGPAPYAYLTTYTFQVYPLPSINLSTHAAVPYTGPCLNNLPTPTFNDWSAMLDTVTTVWESEGRPNIYYYGLVKVYCGGGCIAGIGWIGRPVAMGFDGFGPSHVEASETHAHEVGHNLGRRHAPGCGASGVDASFPYRYPDGIGHIGNDTHQNFGFNIDTQAIYPYASYADYMSYCNPIWTSDYTYEAIWSFANSPLRGSQLAQTGGNRTWLISGQIDLQTDRAIFDPAYAIDIPDHLPEPGDYVLELLDQSDRVLAAYSFALQRAQVDDPQRGGEIAGFHLNVPFADHVAALRIRHGSAIVGILTASAVQPQLTAPSQSDVVQPGELIVWAGHAANGNPLSYLVRASADLGKTWQTIGVHLATPSITLRPEDFGGQPVLLEISGSDGLNSSRLDLGPYFVVGK